jgi:hypothetical protein
VLLGIDSFYFLMKEFIFVSTPATRAPKLLEFFFSISIDSYQFTKLVVRKLAIRIDKKFIRQSTRLPFPIL